MKKNYFHKCITGKTINLKLLTKEELVTWLKDQKAAEVCIGYRIEAVKIEGPLLHAFEKKIENMDNDPGNEIWYSYYAIIYKKTIIGTIGPKGKPDSNNNIEIGFGISEKYRNKGMATEAAGLFCEWYFENTTIKAIIAETAKENRASQKVLKKNSFQILKEEKSTITWIVERLRFMATKEYTYEVWAENDNCQFTCAKREIIIDMKEKGLLSKDAVLLHILKASTYEEAMSIYNLRMGFEPYKPAGKPIKCPNNCGSFFYPEGSGECPYCGSIC